MAGKAGKGERESDTHQAAAIGGPQSWRGVVRDEDREKTQAGHEGPLYPERR